MVSTRKTAVVAGVFFIVAAVAAVIGLTLYGPVLNDSGFVSGAGNDTQVLLGALFEVFVAVSVIGTAVTLYPVVRRQNEGLAIGYVAGRVFEATVIAVGMISLLAVVTLRQDSVAAAPGLVDALLAFHDWTFLVGPGFAIGVNTLMLAYLMHRSGLVPDWIARIGLVGGPLIFASSTAILLGAYEQLDPIAGVLAFPVFAWEMSLAGYLIAKGFRRADGARAVPASRVEPLPA
jgi:hypothetical protein